MKRKPIDMTDDVLEDPESSYEEHESLDFDNKSYREEEEIYESIEHELEEVLRDLPEFEVDFEE